MIHIDSLTLKAFLNENKKNIIGGQLQRIKQPNRKELILFIRNNSKLHKFYINIDPDFYHIALLSVQTEMQRYIETPKNSPMFAMLLRKYIQNAKIIDILQPEHERIIELVFEPSSLNYDTRKLVLAIELMGKHSNIILYNQQDKIILGSIHNVGEEKSQTRQIIGLLPYVYPQKKQKFDLKHTSFQEFMQLFDNSELTMKNFIAQTFFDISNDFAAKFWQKYKNFCFNNDFQLFYKHLLSYINLEKALIQPSIDENFNSFCIFGLCEKKISSINEMIDSYYAKHICDFKISTFKAKLLNTLKKESKKLDCNIKNLKIQLNQNRNLDEKKLFADILMANISKEGQFSYCENIEFENLFEPGKKILIPVEKDLSFVQNAQKYYKMYSKMKTALNFVQKRISQLQEKKNIFETEIFYIENSTKIEELLEISNWIDENLKGRKGKKNLSKMNIFETSILSHTVLLGKNSRQNDYILSKLSKPHDLWFHIKDAPSAHLIVKMDNKDEKPAEKLLYESAKFLKETTYGNVSSKVCVIWTLRKYVSKSNSKGLAFVTYKNEQEIVVD